MSLPTTGPSLTVKLTAGIASLGIHAAMIGGILLLARAPSETEAPPTGGGPILFVSLAAGPDRAEHPGRPAEPPRTVTRPAVPAAGPPAAGPVVAPTPSAPPAPVARPRARPLVDVEVSASPANDAVVAEPALPSVIAHSFVTHSIVASVIDAGARTAIVEAVASVPANESGETSSSGAPPAWPGPGEVDRPARPRWPIRPAYPALARHRGEEATVVVEAWVDDGGSVAYSSVLDSGGADFDASALAAIAQSAFRPARLAGHAIASRVALRIHFELRD